jgi:hypothetical protein
MQPWLDGLEHNENKNKTFRLQATSKQATSHKPQATSKSKKRVGPAHKHAPWSAALCHIDNELKTFWTSGHDSAIGAQGSRFASARTMEPS